MKKVLSCLIVFILFSISIFSVSAATVTNYIYGNPKFDADKHEIIVPIEIKNNTGFMGFSILVSYDGKCLAPVSVSKGDILSGIFDDSVGTSANDSIKIVYSGTEDCKGDGVLFTLVFDIKEDCSQNTKLVLSYSEPDTFNEKWQDVKFNCEDVTLKLSHSDSDPEINPDPDPVVNELSLSEKMIDWLNSLPSILKYLLWIFVYPVAFIISLFE